MSAKQPVKIVAGPCSVDEQNLEEIYELSSIEVRDSEGIKQAIFGTRVVGLKSRTAIADTGMGMDFEAIKANLSLLKSSTGYSVPDLKPLPSIRLSQQVIKDTGMLVATEMMFPSMQMPLYEKAGIPKGKFLAWNPATNQLGWPIMEMAAVAGKNGWSIGLKNPKWLGTSLAAAEDHNFQGETSLEKSWKGLVTYAQAAEKIVLIQRGVDIEGKGLYRNYPIHTTAARTKQALKKAGIEVELWFDPSHSLGPALCKKIPEAVLEALKMRLNDGSFLYEGILIEVGNSRTDTEQHISLQELKDLVSEIAGYRELMERS